MAEAHHGHNGTPKTGPKGLLRADAAMAAVDPAAGRLPRRLPEACLIQRWQSSSARQQSLSFEDQLGIVANTAGLIVIVWWVMSFVIAVAAALLERGGKIRAAAAAGVQPRLHAPPGPGRRRAPAAHRPACHAQPRLPCPVPARPGGRVPPHGPRRRAVRARPRSAHAAPRRRPRNRRPRRRPAADPQWKPQRPVVEPGPLARRGFGLRSPRRPDGRSPSVPGIRCGALRRPGWGRSRPTSTSPLEWPRLYQANRDVIGVNPDVLFPGQVLRLPPRT